ncbi:hypothetical protein [Qipengyuania sp.]|uniref:hypothetical protein n=1 Tax=Qipengyuania sp. TaxID=2004515 RepID=UPI0035C80D7A
MQRGPDVPSLTEPQTPALKLALSTARPSDRATYAALFALDERLSKAIAATGEVMLAQIRLAWWRDELAKDPETAAADPLLTGLRKFFGSEAGRLADLVDGWEAALVGEDELARCEQFAAGRASAFALLSEVVGEESQASEASRAGRLWAMADLASGIAGGELAGVAPELAGADRALSLPRALRPVAVVGGLARRALRRRGAPLLGDRMSPLAALRLGLLGR